MYWLGIDLGTSGIKAVVIDETGKVVSMGYAEQNVITPKPGYAEQSPEIWWEVCGRAVQMAVLKGNVDGSEIKAIGFSGQMQGIVMLDSCLLYTSSLKVIWKQKGIPCRCAGPWL